MSDEMSRFRVRRVFRPFVYKIAESLAEMGIRPNHITVVSLLSAVISAIFIALSNVLLAGIAIFMTGLLDGVDGAIARIMNMETRKGAFLDAMLDRYGDVIIIGSFLFYEPKVFFLFRFELWILVAIIGSLMVSYSRARGEAMGVRCLDVGLMGRSERLFLLTIFCILGLFDPRLPSFGLILLAILSNATALHRIFFGFRMLNTNR